MLFLDFFGALVLLIVILRSNTLDALERSADSIIYIYACIFAYIHISTALPLKSQLCWRALAILGEEREDLLV